MRPGGRAALQDRRDAEAGKKSGEPGSQRRAKQTTQPRPERALHAGLHHVHGPQQQGDGAGKLS